MAKKLKSWPCGRLVMQVIYTAPSAGDSKKARAQKQKASTEARERLNARTSYAKLERCLATNFDTGDLLITATYDDGHLPEEKKKAVGNLRRFFCKLRRNRKLRKEELLYIYVTEGCCPGGRLHHHIIMNATGNDLDELRALWTYGYIDIQRIVIDKANTYEDLASYLTKEPREWGHPHMGERTWTPSLGLKKSEPETVEVPDSLTVAAPPGADLIAQDGPHRNGWGEWMWIKYLLPYNPARRKPKAKRQRHKKDKKE